MADDELKKTKNPFDLAYETRNLEINLFWIRYGAFWIIVAAAFIGFAELYNSKSIYSLFLASFGLISSLSWTLINRGSKYWQETWEDRAGNSDETNFFKTWAPLQKKNFWSAKRYSVSKVAIILSDAVTSFWILIFLFDLLTKSAILLSHNLQINQFFIYHSKSIHILKDLTVLIVVIALTIIFVFILLKKGKSTLMVIDEENGIKYRLEKKNDKYYFSYFEKDKKVQFYKKTIEQLRRIIDKKVIVERMLERLPDDGRQL